MLSEENRRINELDLARFREQYYTYEYLYRDKKKGTGIFSTRVANRISAQKKSAKRRAAKYNAVGTFLAIMLYDRVMEYDSKCYYCGRQLYFRKRRNQHDDNVTIDHYIPLSKGGTNYVENIVPACAACNHAKLDKMPWEFKPGEGSEPREGLTNAGLQSE